MNTLRMVSGLEMVCTGANQQENPNNTKWVIKNRAKPDKPFPPFFPIHHENTIGNTKVCGIIRGNHDLICFEPQFVEI